MILTEDKPILYLTFKIPKSSTLSLYDYSLEDPSIIKLNATIDNNSYILIRKGTEILRVDRQSDIEENKSEKFLFHIKKTENSNYSIDNPYSINFSEYNLESLNNKLWYTINSEIYNFDKKNIINEDYEICKNDVLKFGNVKYYVRELNIDSEIEKIKEKTEENNDTVLAETENNIDNIDNNYKIHELNNNTRYSKRPNIDFEPVFKTFIISDQTNEICELCKKSKYNNDNLLIQFCPCHYLHFECLKNKIKLYSYFRENEKVDNYYINNLKCKTCNFKFPLRFQVNGKRFNLIDFMEKKIPDKDYMILESLENNMYYGYMKLIHVIKFKNDNDEIRIGRHQHKNDMIICDPSISRTHAKFIFNREKKSVLIKNLSEKFGTFVFIKGPLTIINKMIEIQTGKIKFGVKKMALKEFDDYKYKLKNLKFPLPSKY